MAEDKKKALLEEATELGLSFAKNARISVIENAIRKAKEDMIIQSEAYDSDSTNIEPDIKKTITEDNAKTEAEIRAQLEEEYAEKLKAITADITEKANANFSSADVGDSRLGKQLTGREKVARMKKATRLVRCVVTCRNPAKKDWDGEILSVSNDVIGTMKKFVPYNIEEGYHIPQIIFNALKDKTCTIFVNKKVNGENVKVGKQIKEFGLEILDPLTQDELSELAAEQNARGSIDR